MTTAAPTANSDAAELSGPAGASRRNVLAAAAVLSTLLYSIDGTIVNVALPSMQGSLQATQDQAAWIATIYILASAISTPLAGWLGVRFGIRRVLLVSIAGFTATSALCGLADSLTQIILFRMVQGAFGAALVPLSQVALLREFPRSSHQRVTALWGMAVMLGPVIGPTLGGWLTDELSWRWAFYVNLPVGALAWLALALSMPKASGDRERPFDVTGFVLLSLAIGLFQLMLDRGEMLDWFTNPEIVAEAFFSVLFVYMFIVHSLTYRRPFVDIHLFSDRNLSVSLIIQFAIGVCLYAPSVLVPSFLQTLQGHTPAQAGMLLGTRGLGSVLAMLIASRVSGKIDPKLLMLFGILASAFSLWQMSSFSIDTPEHIFMAYGFLQGIGMPLAFIPLSFVAFSTLSDASRPEASVLLTLVRNIGGSTGISLGVAVLSHSASVNQSYLAEHFTPYSTERWAAIGNGPGANLETAGLLNEIGRQALNISYSNDFRILGVAILLCAPLLLMFRNKAP